MTRLSPQTLQFITDKLTYTPSQQSILDERTHRTANFFGTHIQIPVYYISTMNGIQEQLDKFQTRTGLIYIAEFTKQSGLQIEKTPITLEKLIKDIFTDEKIFTI